MLSKLTDREKIFVLVGALSTVLLLIFFGIQRLSAYKAGLKKQIETRQKNITIINNLANQYKKLKGKKLKITLEPDSVLPEIEKLLVNNSIKEMVSSFTDSKETMKKDQYTKTLVKVRINTAPFASLSKFFYDVEENQQYWLKIEYCRLRKVPNKPGMYDANVRIASYYSTKKK